MHAGQHGFERTRHAAVRTLKPVGIDPATGKEPHAVVQLRQDNKAGTLYNIVGFQTHLRWPEQKRVFRLIPGLENAEFARYGVMHRNIYINSPGLIDAAYRMKSMPGLYFAGQITGVEGYVESASSGLVAGINAARQYLGEDLVVFPENTAIGSLAAYVSGNSTSGLQPMNASFGLIKEPGERIRNKKLKHQRMAEIALEQIDRIKAAYRL